MAAYWCTIGTFLIAHHKLKVIQRDNHGQCIDCLREMLATWLKGTDASPAALVLALRSAGMTVLAKKLALKYGENGHTRFMTSLIFCLFRSTSNCYS